MSSCDICIYGPILVRRDLGLDSIALLGHLFLFEIPYGIHKIDRCYTISRAMYSTIAVAYAVEGPVQCRG